MARKSRKNLDAAPVQAVTKTVYRVGAYIRLSVVDKKQRGDSIETQQAIIGAFIAEQLDLVLTETYIDNGLSGQTFERPEFKRMIADMESGRINCCIVKDLSRLGRNAIDTGYYIEKFFPALGVRFVAVIDDVDSADGRNNGIMMNLKNMVNEAYAIDVGRKIRATVQMNIRGGGFVGGTAPYGYLKSREDCHKLVVDEGSAHIVRRIFDMAAGGQTIASILEWLNGNEILPPRRYMHSIGLATEKEIGAHIHWSNQAVSRILRNRMYCGDMVQGQHRMDGQVSKKLPESEWVITENTHEAIIAREVFDIVQELRDKFCEGQKGPRFTSPKSENAFRQKIFCSCCGFVMMRRRDGETYYGFKCNSRKLYSHHACGGMYLHETTLKKLLLGLLRRYGPALAQAMASLADTAPEESADTAAIAAIQVAVEKSQQYLSGLYESLVLGVITESEYSDLKSNYETKIASLTEQEKNLRDSARHHTERKTELAKAQESITTIIGKSEWTAQAIDKLVEKIHVYKGGKIGVKFIFMEDTVFSGEGVGDE